MALTNARDILNKKILGNGGGVPSADEIPIDIEGLSATKLSVGLEEIVLDISQLSSSILTVSGKVEDLEDAANYSETEHVVGKWTDGSTIYERTFVLTNTVLAKNNGWAPSEIDASDMNIIVDVMSLDANNSYYSGFFAAIINGYVNFQSSSSLGIIMKTVTLRYTKPVAAQSTRSTKKKSK